MNKPQAIALYGPDMNILVDMLKYAKNVYSTGNEPIPEVVLSMKNLITNVEKQLKDQPALEPPKGLVHED